MKTLNINENNGSPNQREIIIRTCLCVIYLVQDSKSAQDRNMAFMNYKKNFMFDYHESCYFVSNKFLPMAKVIIYQKLLYKNCPL